jgi:DNA-binding NarL/FixJ family response regulator
MAFSDEPPDQAEEAAGRVVVFSHSELIGDGLVGLLPRAWRPKISVASDLPTLERLIATTRPAVIIDADTSSATEAVQMTTAKGGSAIVLLGPDSPELEVELLDQADAVLQRDEIEALTLRIAIAAGQLGLRLVPRAPAAGDPASELAFSSLSDPARRALELLADGMRDAEIAHELHLSESAVRKLVQRAVRSVGARTRCQAVAIAARGNHRNRVVEGTPR